MPLNQSLLPEFDHEMANTRKTLERVPDDKFAWKPHEKSYSMGDLATHLANLVSWMTVVINSDSFDMAPKDAPPPKTEPLQSRQAVLEAFDKHVAAAREALAYASDEQLLQAWSLLAGDKTIFTLPRIGALRGFVMNHSIHHRAQLGVYLRLNDIPVPALYGPSADEGGM